MVQIARYIGGAGTGKTRLLMDRLGDVIGHGVDPLRIGFVSFTKAARTEAAERAGEFAGVTAKQLTDDGWFKTLHGVCYRALGISKGQMLSGDKASREWLEEHIGVTDTGDSEEGLEAFRHESEEKQSLSMWSQCRLRLESLDAAVERIESLGGAPPGGYQETIRNYEQAKRLDDRYDFTDLLLQFAGIRYTDEGEPTETTPLGDPPPLHTWFFDEQQDTSPLLDLVCKRLVRTATWAYIVGDPMQAIYGFAGSDGTIFQQWDVAKHSVMPKSYRCGAEIHAYGEACLRQASDYWDRGIASADHEGGVEHQALGPWSLNQINSGESWLILARTNYQAKKLMARVEELRLPWAPTKGLGGWNRPAWRDVCLAAYLIQRGASIPWKEYKRLVEKLPAKIEDGPLLERGFKTELASSAAKPRAELVDTNNLKRCGGTDLMKRIVASGELLDLIEGGDRFAEVVREHGPEATRILTDPPIKVGTIHSVKGREADNVLWVTSSTKRIAEACRRSQAVFDEECRVSYVAATRARNRLIVAREPNQQYRMPTP